MQKQFSGGKQKLLEVAQKLRALPEVMNEREYRVVLKLLEDVGFSIADRSSVPYSNALWLRMKEYEKNGMSQYQAGEKIWAQTLSKDDSVEWTAYQAFGVFVDYPLNVKGKNLRGIIGMKKNEWKSEEQRNKADELFKAKFVEYVTDYVKLMKIDASRLLKMVADEIEAEANEMEK